MMDSNNFPLSLYCENCEREGYARFKNNNFFVRCSVCNTETAQVYCPKCDMGGQFIKNVEKHPSTWKCPECKKTYNLPDGFYDSFEQLYFEENIPYDLEKNLPKTATPFRRGLTTLLLFLAMPVTLTIIGFVQNRIKTIDTLINSLAYSIIFYLPVLAILLIPTHALGTGKIIKRKDKKNWRTSQVTYLSITLSGALASLYIFFQYLLPIVAQSQKSEAAYLLLIASAAVFSIISGIYAIIAKVVPVISRPVIIFIKHDLLHAIGAFQILLGAICILLIYFWVFT